MDVPQTRYVRTDDGIHLAYQVFGEGPPTVLISPLLSNVEMSWDHELYRRALEHIGSHLRLVHFDKRGIGCSDRFEHHPTLEQRISDIEAVMDAAGFEKAHLWGLSEGGLMAQLFAVRHPDRVDRVLLVNSAAGADSAPFFDVDELADLAAFFETMIETWGERPELMVERMMPSQLDNPSFVRWLGRLQRLSANKADMRRQVESVIALESADDLSALTARTMVMHSEGDRVLPRHQAEYLADRIPDCEVAFVAGDDHFLWVNDNWRQTIDRAITFLTGRAVEARTERRFATVLFTDLVESTTLSAAAGDASWHETLDGHDRICRQVIDHLGGRLVKSTGDGVLATFDSPSAAVGAALALKRHLAAIGLPIRAGLHAGEIEVHSDGDISGLAVNLAARVEQAAEDGTVFTSSTLRDLMLGGDAKFDDRGRHVLKGIEGDWQLYEVLN